MVYRLFLRKDNGACLYRYSVPDASGLFPIEDDFNLFTSINGYNPDAVVVKEITDLETIEKLKNCTNVSLDITTGTLLFDFTPQQIEDLDTINVLRNQVLTLEQEKTTLQLALAESIEKQETDKVNNQLALAELIETLSMKGVI